MSGTAPGAWQGAPHPQYVLQPAPRRGLSIASMVLGLCSFALGFTFLVPIVGFCLGIAGLRREPDGRGMAIAGVILNGLFVVGWALLLVVLVTVGFGVFGAAVSSGGALGA